MCALLFSGCVMTRIIRVMEQVHDHISDYCAYLGAFLLLVLPFIMSYEVVMRYFFNDPTIWAVDFCEYILIYTAFLTAPWLMREKGHVNLSFVVDRLGDRGRTILELCQSLAGVVISLLLTLSGMEATRYAAVKGVLIVRPLVVPKYLILIVIPFGAFLLFLYFVRFAFNSAARLRKPEFK
jgi:C4-dicarboxylate transporter, DctQ subunit